jgi:hypothetical protein
MGDMDVNGGNQCQQYAFQSDGTGQTGSVAGQGQTGGGDVSDVGEVQTFEQWSIGQSQNNVAKHDKANDALMMLVFNYDQAKKNMEELAQQGKAQS